jgi:hypothetical protein
VLAGGVAYRFFFWILAMSLLTNGALGFLDGHQVHEALVAQGVDAGVATELYGVLGVVFTILFWLYIAGRLVIGAPTVNASLHEQRSQEPVSAAEE